MTPTLARRTLLTAGFATGVAALTACSVNNLDQSEELAATTTTHDPTRATPTNTGKAPTMDEQWRPQFHYTATEFQINDPNGLLWYDGEYHLFHQYNIHGAVHWGHAVSTDLLGWTSLAPALAPDSLGQIWSGSAVVDIHNTSGFKDGEHAPLVALFTYSRGDDQSQGLAFSTDRGRTWQKYAGNPVLPNPGTRDFRDPKVFWHAPSGRWVMVLATGDHVQFYCSADLRQWQQIGQFGQGHGSPHGTWECPDLFELKVDGEQESRWLLSISLTDGAPAGGSGMQYFVGTFDGATFINDNPPSTVLWQNYGSDFYAGVTWGDAPVPDSRRLMIAWTDNWKYREYVPTRPFNGQLSTIRELTLRREAEGLRLYEIPAREYVALRQPLGQWKGLDVDASAPMRLPGVTGDQLEILADFDVVDSRVTDIGLNVRVGRGGEHTVIGYDARAQQLYLDRSHAGAVPVRDGKSLAGLWNPRMSGPLQAHNGSVRLRILIDRSSVEVFGNDGQTQLSALVLPKQGSSAVELFARGARGRVQSLTANSLRRTVR